MKYIVKKINKLMVFLICMVVAFSQPLSIIAYAEEPVVSEEEKTEEETTEATAEDNTEDEVKDEIDNETEDNIEDNTEDESKDEAIDEIENENEDESKDEVIDEIENETEDNTNDDIEEKLEDSADDKSEDESDDELEDKTEDKPEIEIEDEIISLDVYVDVISKEGCFIFDEEDNIYVTKGIKVIISGDFEEYAYSFNGVKINVVVDGEDKTFDCYKSSEGYVFDSASLNEKDEYEIQIVSVEVKEKKHYSVEVNATGEYLGVSIGCMYDHIKDFERKEYEIYNEDYTDVYYNSFNGFFDIRNVDDSRYAKASIWTVGNTETHFKASADEGSVERYKLICTYYSFGFWGGEERTRYIIVDKKDPVLEFELLDDAGEVISDYEDEYLSNASKAKIKVADDYLGDLNGNVIVTVTRDGADYRPGMSVKRLISDVDEYVYTIDFAEDGEYSISVNCKDEAGNVVTLKSGKFTIDKTTPEVSISFDNNNPKNGYYYNSDRTATISVNEKNFDTEDYTFKVNSKYGNSVTLGSWSQSGDEYTCKVVFKGDDEYSASFSCEDKAGNKSDEIKVDRFVVDKTAPKLDCSYDNTFAHKANYYNAARTAKITVNDMSFTSDLVDIDNSSDQNVTITGWSGDGNSYSSEILCTADGKYQFYVYAEDLAGNKSERLDCGSFIIDTTAPTIEISGVMDKSANSGAVIPTVNCKDINLDNDNSIVTVSGYKNGVVNPSDINLVDGSGKNVTYNIFAFEKVSDDIYAVTVVAEDMAGNKAEISYMFSVNRFGSTFGVTQQTADLVGKYYTNAEQDLVLLETNVDNVDEQELYITKNGKNIKLVKGVDYFVEKEGTDATWKAYTYTVKKNNFVEEGTYEVSLFTKDKAGNQSDSNAQGMTIKFAVDKTAPSIVVAGIEDSKLYESSSLDINIDVQDNMEINYAEILIDGKVVKKYAANELNDIVTYSIEESEDSMTVIVRAVDVVGNLSEKKYENVVVSTIVKAEETVEVKDEIVPLSDADSTQEIVKSSEIDNVLVPDNNSLEEVVEKTDVFFYGVLITVAVLACVGGTAIVLRRKRK